MTNSRELFICALLFLLKNIYLGGPGRYPFPYPFPYRSPSLLLAGCGLRAWYLRHSAAKWSLLSTSSVKLVSKITISLKVYKLLRMSPYFCAQARYLVVLFKFIGSYHSLHFSIIPRVPLSCFTDASLLAQSVFPF